MKRRPIQPTLSREIAIGPSTTPQSNLPLGLSPLVIAILLEAQGLIGTLAILEAMKEAREESVVITESSD